MKRLIALFSIILVSVATYAQHTTARGPVDNGNATNFNPTRLTQTLTDAAGKDTVYISPGAHYNYYSINAADTMKGSLTIGLQNTTKNGVTYTKSNVWKYDEVIFDYRSGGTIKDTLFFYGAFKCDSAGSGSATRIIVPVDATKTSYVVKFIWDGANFVQSTLYK